MATEDSRLSADGKWYTDGIGLWRCVTCLTCKTEHGDEPCVWGTWKKPEKTEEPT